MLPLSKHALQKPMVATLSSFSFDGNPFFSNSYYFSRVKSF